MITKSETEPQVKLDASALKPACVSVVIPCYNHARYLGQTIESVLKQTYRQFEIIVVDDGSTDNTAHVARSFGERVQYLYQPNAGLSAARNTGIRAASGEFIAFLDADDLWHADFLATLVPLLQNDPRLGAVYAGSQFIDASGNVLPQLVTRTVPADALRDALTDGDFFPVHAVVARTRVFTQAGFFDESLRASEDWDMWLRIAKQYAFAGVPHLLALYRMHTTNMSRDLGRMLDSQLRVASKNFGLATGKPDTWTDAQRRAYAGIFFWQALAFYQRNEADYGAEYAACAFTINPKRMNSLDAFYALVFAEQPPGYVGDLTRIDLPRTIERINTILAKVFETADRPAELDAYARNAHATAYFALGLVAYGKRELTWARQWLWRAWLQQPALLFNRQWLATWLKSLAGNRLLNALIQWKRKTI